MQGFSIVVVYHVAIARILWVVEKVRTFSNLLHSTNDREFLVNIIMIEKWNNLPANVKEAPNVVTFKSRYDATWKEV